MEPECKLCMPSFRSGPPSPTRHCSLSCVAPLQMLLALVPAGGHIVTTTDCYRRTRQFIQTVSRILASPAPLLSSRLVRRGSPCCHACSNAWLMRMVHQVPDRAGACQLA